MRNRAWVTWGIIFAVLLGSGILTILIPALLGGGSATALPREQSTITITPPIAIGGSGSFTLASWVVMLALALIVPALVIGAGLTLGIVLILISRFINRTKAGEKYQQSASVLDKRYADTISAMRQTRPTSRAPQSTWKRWAVITTALTVFMFVAFVALLLASMAVPSGQVVRGDSIVNMTSLFVLAALLLALVVMAFTLRGDRLTAPDRSGTMPIPWDFVVVTITCLLVVGLGVAVIAILNGGG